MSDCAYQDYYEYIQSHDDRYQDKIKYENMMIII